MFDENLRMTSSRDGGQTSTTNINGQLDDIDGVCRSVLDSGIDSMRSAEFAGIGDFCYSENRSDSLCNRLENVSLGGQYNLDIDGAISPGCDLQTVDPCTLTDQGFEDADRELEEEISLESVIDVSAERTPYCGEFTHDELLIQDEDGDTQLHIAIIQRNMPITFKLIEKVFHGDLLDIHNDMNQTALHLAVITNQPDIVNKLVMSGANPHIRDRNGNTPLHLAATQGNIDCVKELIKSCQCVYAHNPEVKAFINLFNYAGHTSLHEAGLAGHVNIVECLLRCGADINTPDGTSGRTLLHHAVERNNITIVKLLCDWPRVNIDQPTWSGSTPYQMAVERGFTEVVEMLVAAGADAGSAVCMESSDGHDSSMDDITEEFTDFVINGQPL